MLEKHKTNNLTSSIILYKDWTNLQASRTGSNKKMLNSLSMNLSKKALEADSAKVKIN